MFSLRGIRKPVLVSATMIQRRGLRVRPSRRSTPVAPPPPNELKMLSSETLTLSDGTTIRIQADAPARTRDGGEEEREKELRWAKRASASTNATTPSPAPPSPPTTDPFYDLTPSPPSAPLKRRIPPQKQNQQQPLPSSSTSPWNLHLETPAPTLPQTHHATAFFTQTPHPPSLLRSFAHFRALPDSDVPEVAFIGRSNAGKSSLLNALLGLRDARKVLARTSKTPGFTSTMNFYGVGSAAGGGAVRIKRVGTQGEGATQREKISGPGGVVIVDMPGYGAGSLTSWGEEITKYLHRRKQLRRVFVLVDAAVGLKESDRAILASLRLSGVGHQVVLAKLDKLYVPAGVEAKRADGKGKVKAKGQMEAVRERMGEVLGEARPGVGGGALGEVLGCSSEVCVDGVGLGIEDVRFAVLKAAGLEGSLVRGGGGRQSGKKKAGK